MVVAVVVEIRRQASCSPVIRNGYRARAELGSAVFPVIDDGTCTAAKFETFITELESVLNTRDDLDDAIIFMDNTRIHSPKKVKEILDNMPCTLKFLSPYSYMLNPIEYVFFKIKITSRRILGSLRSEAEGTGNEGATQRLKDIILEGVNEVTVENCTDYILISRKGDLGREKTPSQHFHMICIVQN